jgi:hypothetical protein
MFGNCYRYALETLFDLQARRPNGTVIATSDSSAFDMGGVLSPLADLPHLGKKPVLVHGFIVGRSGELQDQKFGHAWLEGNEWVMDCGSAEKLHQVVRRQEYYDFWRINPSECRHYTLHEANERIFLTGSISGWHPAPLDALK